MADRSLRGMRLGAQSLQSEEGVIFSPRTHYTYQCVECQRETETVFSADADAPDLWKCRFCGGEATLLIEGEPVQIDRSDVKNPRSHWDMLLERRSRDELEQ